MNEDDELLALIDVPRPSSRGGRRSKVKKKVTFSNDVKNPGTTNGSISASTSIGTTALGTGGGDSYDQQQGGGATVALYDAFKDNKNNLDQSKTIFGQVDMNINGGSEEGNRHEAMELRSYSRSPAQGRRKFGIGSIDDLLAEERAEKDRPSAVLNTNYTPEERTEASVK